MKKSIKEIVIVEGKTDTFKLQRIFDVETFETNGLDLDEKKINIIKKISKNKGVILFLDPDGPGEIIRKKIMDKIESAINIFITKEDMIKGTKKIGVAECTDDAIIKAFEKAVKFDKRISSLSLEEYLSLSIDTKIKREKICKYLNIHLSNNKQLYKRLNMMNIDYKKLKSIVEE